MKFHNIICTFFGIGKVKFAPGTFGSLAAFPFWLIFYPILDLGLLYFFLFWAFLLVFLFFLGTHCSDIYAKETGKKDASEIVIDEVLGQSLSMFLSFYLMFLILVLFPNLGEVFSIYAQAPIIYILANFIFFRLFDITKPSLVGFCDKNLKNGLGVMMDDVVAGVFSAIVVVAIPFVSLFF